MPKPKPELVIEVKTTKTLRLDNDQVREALAEWYKTKYDNVLGSVTVVLSGDEWDLSTVITEEVRD